MLLVGLAGMVYGLWISTVADREVDAIQIAVGTFFPVMVISGVLWPLEGMPVGLRYFSLAFPTTWGVKAMRSILLRGYVAVTMVRV